jgi:hypothetical protein
MNNPLRYGGQTYFQAGFLEKDAGTILQVVRNPAWLTPYFACIVVGLGLLVQFSMHFFGFLKKSANRRSATAKKPKESPELAPVGASFAAQGAGSAPTSKRRNS